jgi:hypothetical protein
MDIRTPNYGENPISCNEVDNFNTAYVFLAGHIKVDTFCRYR